MNEHMTTAVIDYLWMRKQMTPGKAAAHTIQKYGITARELSEALADERLLLSDAAEADERQDDDA